LSNIRVTYSALISLIVGVIGTITGLIFILIVTRSLSPEEFGTWGLIFGLFSSVTLFEPIIGFWVTREIARGKESGKTAIVTSSLFSIGAIFIFLVITYFISNPTGTDPNLLFFGSILIPAIFLNRTMNAICLGHKPHAVSMGQLAFGITQVLMVLLFVFYLDMSVVGLITAVTISYLTSITIQIVYSKEKLKEGIKKKLIKKWLKISWLPLYQGVGGSILRLDIIIFSVITGSTIGIAYWTVAFTVVQLLTIVGGISIATYSKILEGKNKEFIQDNLRHLLFFAIPITSMILVLAKPGLFLLNPLYIIAYPVVIILTIQTLLSIFSVTFQSIIMGLDSVDISKSSTFKQYVKSKLFFMPTIMLIQYIAYIIILTIVIFLLSNQSSEIDLVIFWSMILLLTQIPTTLYGYVLMKKQICFKIDIPSISKYLLVGIIVFSSLFILTPNYFNYDDGFYDLILQLLVVVLLGFGGYLFGTYVLDVNTRNLFKSILDEIKKIN
jgi:O-antigen/teichoic acid export membrane protein